MEANVESKIVSVEDLAVSTDPVVYQLVRVDGDGRLVPATDDEIMVVEDFLEDDKIEHIESDPGQSLKHGTLERYNAGTNYQPDLSNLTVKELQDIFKAAFGKETTVKDKQWLKRRINMGLTNSHDFPKTDGVLMKRGKEQSYSVKDVKRREDFESLSSPLMDDHDFFTEGKDVNIDQRAAKRVRKPTKRYIEELSEVENRDSSGKSISPNKSYYEARAKSVPNVSFNRPLVTRQDSLGGSGVQIPYASRVRRGRPRENLMPLMKVQPDGFRNEGARSVKGFGERGAHFSEKKGNEVLGTRLSVKCVQRPVIEEDINKKVTEMENSMEVQNTNSEGDTSDDNVGPTRMSMPQSGMRRKHHRPWSLSEVVKLVEGVAKYGAGRWSEIKRVAFASSPYRTSVDLKDKWRNLLRASFAQLPAEKATQNARKHSSIPIPAAILVRVRELADMQAQVAPIISSPIKFGSLNNNVSLGRSVRSGYL